MVTWIVPDEGWIKGNANGSLISNSFCAGCGGLLRDEHGNWISGFSRFLGRVSIIKAEAWALLEVSRLAATKNVANLALESDSLIVVNALSDSSNCPVEIMGIIREIRNALSSFRSWRITHTWREGNACADYMAGLAVNQSSTDLVVWEIPPPPLRLLLLRDKLGLGVERGER